jgi:hypothetical protein
MPENLLYPQIPGLQAKADGPPQQGIPGRVYQERDLADSVNSMQPGETCWLEPDITSQMKFTELRRMGAAGPGAAMNGLQSAGMPDNDTDDNLIRY